MRMRDIKIGKIYYYTIPYWYNNMDGHIKAKEPFLLVSGKIHEKLGGSHPYHILNGLDSAGNLFTIRCYRLKYLKLWMK